jgi:hypothetical protein
MFHREVRDLLHPKQEVSMRGDAYLMCSGAKRLRRYDSAAFSERPRMRRLSIGITSARRGRSAVIRPALSIRYLRVPITNTSGCDLYSVFRRINADVDSLRWQYCRLEPTTRGAARLAE